MICYSGYWTAPSGMGEACRNYVRALSEAGVDLTVELCPNVKATRSLGPNYELCRKLHNLSKDYQIKIIHITPDSLTTHLEPMKYHIFHLFWETDRLTPEWVWALNLCDEIWTGGEWNKQVFIRSGVKKPIFVFPQPLDTQPPAAKPFKLKDTNSGRMLEYKHVFYSIFQWIERKDPRSLLEAYWREFDENPDVILLLKVYREHFSREEHLQIIRDIENWKTEVKCKSFPKIALWTYQLSNNDIHRFHETGDFFVSAHRGEGWGIPMVEAMVHHKPVISTCRGGFCEHVPKEYRYSVGFSERNVFGMEYVPWYTKDQKWAQVDVDMLRKQMRSSYTNLEETSLKSDLAYNYVTTNFSYLAVGKLLKDRLEEIQKNL